MSFLGSVGSRKLLLNSYLRIKISINTQDFFVWKIKFQRIISKYRITLPKWSTIIFSLDYYLLMTDLYSASSSVSPLTAILWCLYPMAVLVIIELLLGGGFDDDNNDDQDGGMLIPAYSRSNA